tara:strand:- start:8796 stop:9083 length:288 start_codon:yes stop_codon:yes gene_type:complete
MQQDEVRYLVNEINSKIGSMKFLGAIVTQEANHDLHEFWPTLVFKDETGEMMFSTIMQDPEGNGPGWMDIYPCRSELGGLPSLTETDIARLIKST